jgi:protein tyrosine phosphatase
VCDDLILKMDEEINQGYSNPFLVHCSDGVGRSGTFIALFIIIKCLMMQKKDKVENPKFNVFNVVRKLREERYSMVNNASMYKYIYDFSKKWIEMFYNI